MNKVRDNPPPYQPGESYGAWCWSALSGEYQRKFTKRGSVHLQAKVDRMLGYESLSRNDDIVLAAISYLILNRGPLKLNRTLVSFQDEFPDITVISGSSKALLVRCSKGHEWTVQASDLREGNRCGDPLCHPRARSLDSYRDEFADITVISGNSEALLVRCSDGHEWTGQACHLRNGSRCGICAVSGFDNSKPAWLYFMERPGEMQIGITNHIGDRLKYHARNGWELIEVDGPHSGVSIEIREKAIKAYLRAAGLLIPGKHEDWLTSEWEPYSLQAIEHRVTTNQGEMT